MPINRMQKEAEWAEDEENVSLAMNTTTSIQSLSPHTVLAWSGSKHASKDAEWTNLLERQQQQLLNAAPNLLLWSVLCDSED